jgi:hypothetical protein
VQSAKCKVKVAFCHSAKSNYKVMTTSTAGGFHANLFFEKIGYYNN